LDNSDYELITMKAIVYTEYEFMFYNLIVSWMFVGLY